MGRTVATMVLCAATLPMAAAPLSARQDDARLDGLFERLRGKPI